ncbi:MAG: tRNA (guanine(10)-N(2))-dimethyltransferase [Thermoplasmata archaeon]|nr:tRNA (guanine(10)-N(2))-dimethyltransferase [Thermoplasmata archaeon]
MTLSTIIEGQTKLVVPDTGKDIGPASKARIFYNPAMRSNRDITVLFGKAIAKDGWNILDALGGTGAKGIRLANELDTEVQVQINDLSQEAFQVIKKNIRANKLKNVTASNEEFNALLSNNGYDWIDIDPFGSPVKFIDLAARRLSRGGILSITATDTAPLCGTKPETCQRRYLATPLKSEACHEFGLRILVGNTIRRAAVFDYGLEPVFAYYHGHYFRAFFRKKKGAKTSNAGLEKIAYIQWDEKKGYSVHEQQPEGKFAGPLWIGDLWNPSIVKKLLKAWDEDYGKESLKILENLGNELLQPPYHYHMDQVASLSNSEPLKTDSLVEELQKKGFTASGVHYNRKGFRTDASLSELIKIFRKQ